MRARQPDRSGYAVNGGVRIYYDVCGDGEPTILFVPGYQVMHSRAWKMQVPFLARSCRVIVYDSRGSGKSDRPATDYGKEALVGDALAVADTLGLGRFAIVAISGGARPAVTLTARQPDRISGLVLIGASLYPGASWARAYSREQRRNSILNDFDGFVRDFWAGSFPEPHSTKARDDGWDYTHETDARTLVATADYGWMVIDARPDVHGVRCPVLLVHGTQDTRVPYPYAAEWQQMLPQSQLVTIGGGGHFPILRDPVRTNLLIREFLSGLAPLRVPSRERLGAIP